MKLNIQERLTLVNLVPEKGNFITMSIVDGLRLILYPSEAEVKKFDLKQDDRLLTWNEEGSKKTEVKISDSQIDFLMDQLEKKSIAADLDFLQYSVYKRLKDEKRQ
jgi:hypothetical protein